VIGPYRQYILGLLTEVSIQVECAVVRYMKNFITLEMIMGASRGLSFFGRECI